MKKIIVLLVNMLFVSSVYAQGISFFSGSWNDVLIEAKQKKKVVFVDVYTEWCGPCKLMEKNVFSDEQVGKYYNVNFICYKLDGEKGEGPEIVKKYGIKGYPTCLYLDEDGKLLYRFSGAKDVNEFLEEVNRVNVCAEFGGWEKMESAYKNGSNDINLLKAYYELCPQYEKKRVMSRYLMALPDSLLFAQETGKLFEEGLAVDNYDYSLLQRLIEGRVKMGQQSAEFDFVFTFPLQFKMTMFFNASIENGDWNRFKELLSLKRNFAVLPRSLDGDINIIEGRGLYFASEDLLALMFQKKNRNNDVQFVQLMEKYMGQIEAQFPLDTIAKRRAVLEQVFSVSAFVGSALFKEHALFGQYITECIDYYWRLVPSDKVHKKLCVKWLEYLSKLNPYCAALQLDCAVLFVRCHQEKLAIKYLERAIKSRKALPGIETWPKDMKRVYDSELRLLQDGLRDVRNHKL